MNAARTLTDNAIRIGRTWYFANGKRLPVVCGADDDGPVTIPEDLTPLSADDLETLDEQLVAEFDALADADEQDLAAMTAIAEGLTRLRAEKVKRDEQKAADQEKIDALREQVHPVAEVDDGDGEGGDGGDEGGDDPGDGAPNEGGDGGDGAEAKPADAKEPVMAGGAPAPRKKASAAGTAGRAKRPVVPDAKPLITITAAADLPGMSPGAEMDLTQVAEGLHAKARALSNHSSKVPVARFHIPYAADQIVRKGFSSEQTIELIDRVTAPRTAEALLAAGGWCTPSVNSYDLLALDGQTGLLDVPSVGIERGGINIPSYIGIDAANGALWTWSEDQDELGTLVISDLDVASNVATFSTTVPHLLVVGDMINVQTNTAADGPHVITGITDADTATFDGTGLGTITNATGTALRTKGCMRIACPTWTEYRLGAYGLCIEHGNLMDRSFPELTRRYVQLAMNAHMHRVSAVNIAKIASSPNADSVTQAAVPTDSFGRLMNAVELQIADYRSQYKVSDNVAMEVLMPTWTREMLRSDLSMRAGVDLLNVTDAQIDAAFATRNARPQFLEDYKPLFGLTTPATAATAWPVSTEFITYPTGDFVEGNGGQIDLGVVRDSRLNATNDFTAAWTEDFRLLARRGPKARKVTVALATTGVTGCC